MSAKGIKQKRIDPDTIEDHPVFAALSLSARRSIAQAARDTDTREKRARERVRHLQAKISKEKQFIAEIDSPIPAGIASKADRQHIREVLAAVDSNPARKDWDGVRMLRSLEKLMRLEAELADCEARERAAGWPYNEEEAGDE